MSQRHFIVESLLHLPHLFLNKFLLVEELRLHSRHFRLFGHQFRILRLNRLLQGRDFLLKLRDFRNVIRIRGGNGNGRRRFRL